MQNSKRAAARDAALRWGGGGGLMVELSVSCKFRVTITGWSVLRPRGPACRPVTTGIVQAPSNGNASARDDGKASRCNSMRDYRFENRQ
jgi:hypothetical protein